ncbi:DUF2780 domain-containing protein [Shewanella glacialimarina]|jgi:hypothetical protein|uniref:DUF2780 domain-containing protein n=1 Tax=Shewanella glacialimarina TaxID=2590884 RepID=UPI001CF8A7BE|nr:DUF2780 domain-containing protein [Shewanella glacialimarina]UCX03247.1 DUF2780 domain-containing protein [Shewanella glacialimarina]
MNRSIIACSVLSAVLLSAPANAGWLDNVTKKEVVPVATQAAAVTGLADNALVGNVMSQLGLTEQQAAGGLGSILNLAQSNLGNNDFSTLSNSIPGIDSLLGAVPAMGGDSGMSGLLSKAGNLGSSFQGAAVVYDSFEKLGISKEYIAPMVDIAKQYLQQQSGQGTVDLLMKGLGSLL